jgi:hypothetical protein
MPRSLAHLIAAFTLASVLAGLFAPGCVIRIGPGDDDFDPRSSSGDGGEDGSGSATGAGGSAGGEPAGA